MNLGGYSGGGGMHLFGVFLLLFIFIGPYVLLWLHVRAFRSSEAQPAAAIVMLVLFGLPACYCAWNANHLAVIPIWLIRFQLLLMQINVVTLPFTLVWEAYKHGWLTMLAKKFSQKKKRKRKKIRLEE